MNRPPPARNLLGVTEQQPLWRVYPVHRLLQLLETRNNVLVAPGKWEDPFEDVLSRCSVKIANEVGSLGGLTARSYGQCWTDAPAETDATWRIYAPGSERGIRVRVQAGKLFNTICSSGQSIAALSCFLGKVDYQSEEDIRAWLQSLRVENDLLDTSGTSLAKTLLVKRLEFEHESEVRLLFMDPEHTADAADIRPFGCDPSDLIEHLTLDPRLRPPEVATIMKQLKCFNYAGPVEQSKLYQVPHFDTLKM